MSSPVCAYLLASILGRCRIRHGKYSMGVYEWYVMGIYHWAVFYRGLESKTQGKERKFFLGDDEEEDRTIG